MSVAILGAILIIAGAAAPPASALGAVTLVTHAAGNPLAGSNGDQNTLHHQLSDDGRFSVFMAPSTNLVSGFDNNNGQSPDVYLADHTTGKVTLVSHATSGPKDGGNLLSYAPSISDDGAFVSFTSHATDLVGNFDNNNGSGEDIFVFSRLTGAIKLASHTPAGTKVGGNAVSVDSAVSGDGRFVTFASRATDLDGLSNQNGSGLDIFLYEWSTGQVRVVSESFLGASIGGNGRSFYPVISDNGQFVAYRSAATNLVPRFVDNNGAATDAYVWDRRTADNTLVSHTPGSTTRGANADVFDVVLSEGGGFVGFTSAATNLIALFVNNNGSETDVFRFARVSGTIRLASRSTSGSTTSGNAGSAGPSLSAAGNFVAFTSRATDLVQDFSNGNGATSDAFLYRASNSTVRLVSHTGDNKSGGNGRSGGDLVSAFPDRTLISDDGAYVVFESRATDLVPGFVDNNGFAFDIFRFERVGGDVKLVSRAYSSPTAGSDGSCYAGQPSADGLEVLFGSSALNLVDGFVNNNGDDADVYLSS